MADNNTSNRGLGSPNMDEDTKHKIQSEGGKASSRKQDVSKLGKKGAEAQSTDAKRKGGEHSQQNS